MFHSHKKKVKLSLNRPWRPIGLWDVEALTFSRQSAHRWRWSCQPYAPAALYPQEHSWYLLCISLRRWVEPRAIVRLKGLGQLKNHEKSNDLIANRTRDLPTCSIVPQPTKLPRGPVGNKWYNLISYHMIPTPFPPRFLYYTVTI
jgi:hypothetical protein